MKGALDLVLERQGTGQIGDANMLLPRGRIERYPEKNLGALTEYFMDQAWHRRIPNLQHSDLSKIRKEFNFEDLTLSKSVHKPTF